MDFIDFKTGTDDQGRRLDKVIRIFVPQMPLSLIYKNLRKKLIKVNNLKAEPDYRIKQNDVIQIADFLIDNKSEKTDENPGLSKNTASQIKIKDIIIFENEHFLILNKPAGINVHSARKGELSLETLVTDYYNSTRKNDSLSFRPGPLHRIDKYTQGLICFSMSTAGAQWFSKNMKEHNIKKSYVAIVEGIVKAPELWKDRIEKLDEKGTQFHTVQIKNDDEASSAKDCITKITPVETFQKENLTLTLVTFDIETGRQHQIRAQSAFHGHPLYGDTAYGGHKTSDNKGQFYLQAHKVVFPTNDLGLPSEISL